MVGCYLWIVALDELRKRVKLDKSEGIDWYNWHARFDPVERDFYGGFLSSDGGSDER